MIKINLKEYNITIIDLNELFIKKIADELMLDLQEYDLLSANIADVNVVNFFTHHIVKGIYEAIDRDQKIVILLNTSGLNHCNILEYFDKDSVINLFKSIIDKIPPVSINVSFSLKFLHKKIIARNDEALLIVNNIRAKLDKSKNILNPVDLLKKKQLTWLENHFFSRKVYIN